MRTLGRGLAARFAAARPFRHLVVDGFLPGALARGVARELPRPDDEAFTEGRVGGDGVAICRDPERLGPSWARVDALTRSADFLAALGEACGVADLRRNEAGDCGGLFRYAPDSEMDVHVDSNDVDVHCAQTGHRRKINLLLYLTPGWREDWGGGFDLYAAPSRAPVKSVAPLFNRCVLFDSHDRSWHGVAPITLPRSARGTARFALILNYFSTDRRGTRPGPPHYNLLFPRPLPARLSPGATPDLADLVEVSRLLSRRDARIGALRALRDAAAGKTASAPPAPARGPFDFLDALPREVRPGAPLSSRGHAALRRLFAARDRELKALYRGQYSWVQALRARSPGLVPAGY